MNIYFQLQFLEYMAPFHSVYRSYLQILLLSFLIIPVFFQCFSTAPDCQDVNIVFAIIWQAAPHKKLLAL